VSRYPESKFRELEIFREEFTKGKTYQDDGYDGRVGDEGVCSEVYLAGLGREINFCIGDVEAF